MKFHTLSLTSLVFASLVSVAGCAADAEPEATAASSEELRAEELFCLIWDCTTSNWQKLGEADVNGDLWGDHDRIDVDRDGARFSKIQFRAYGGDVEIDDIEVDFRNGESYSPGDSLDLENDDRSTTISLPGRRAIRSVSFRGHRFPFGGDVTVEVWGRR
jgi:hypothetical protein